MGRTESLNLKNDYERACGWYGHFNKSEMALFSECTDRYAQKLLDTADIVREAIFRQLLFVKSGRTGNGDCCLATFGLVYYGTSLNTVPEPMAPPTAVVP
jgi:hypothetical protein